MVSDHQWFLVLMGIGLQRNNLPVLHTSSRLNWYMTYKSAAMLIRAKLITPSLPSSSRSNPCRQNYCKCCSGIVTTSSFRSLHNNKDEIQHQSQCNVLIRNLIYLISCENCGLHYVGVNRKLSAISG